MSKTYDFINLIKKTEIIYHPNEFNEKITEDMISSIKIFYKNLVTSTITKTLNKFGNELINYNVDADYEDPDYGFIDTEYSSKFITLPTTWQEIIALLYMSLQLHRFVQPNSRVIALGESPLKLVFIQEVLNNNPNFKQVLEQNGIANNIEYNYFPASKLNYYTNTNITILNLDDVHKSKHAFNLDDFISSVENISEQVNNIVIEHFQLFKLDPISIISEPKKIYFQDRAESYRTLLVLICFYAGMCTKQHLTEEQRYILYDKLYIIGFDTKEEHLELDDKIIIDRFNQLLYRMITNKKEIITKDKYHIYKKNFFLNNTDIESCLYDDFNLFLNQDNILRKLTIFLTTPEKTFNTSRCIKSCPITNMHSTCPSKIKLKLQETGNIQIKEPGKDGYNCNIINLFLMICINELEPQYLNNILVNLDFINDNLLFMNDTIDYNLLNRQIIDYILSLTYNTNLLNNILNNKLIINKINDILGDFLKTEGLLQKCNYILPI